MTTSDQASLLFLAHRIPYPPNKGDKIRSFHLLRRMAEDYDVFLGTFVDDPTDWSGVAVLKDFCKEVHAVGLDPFWSRVHSLRSFAAREALSLGYYRNRDMRQWVDKVISSGSISKGFAFSGPMAQYLDDTRLEIRVVDFCDVDSEKWRQYATTRNWPLSWVYRREASRLAEFECDVAGCADFSLFATTEEADLFRRVANRFDNKTVVVRNGVDTEFFDPEVRLPDPYPEQGLRVVFTGEMDYWPNVQAVAWFVDNVLPIVRNRRPEAKFFIVGRNPTDAVIALGGQDGVVVTGAVNDIRSWIVHGHVVVAPLQIARGIQNKVLEAMAMAKPVVASEEAVTGLPAGVESVLSIANSEAEFSASILSLLEDGIERRQFGSAARKFALESCAWQRGMNVAARLLDSEEQAVDPALGANQQ